MLGELSHHAYLIVGPAEQAVPRLREELAETEIILKRLPQFGIGESRDLRERGARAVGERERRAFVLVFESITLEAQQALLKTLEEPAARTKFFIVAPSAQMFLPTLLSRLQIIVFDRSELLAAESRALAQKFLAAKREARLALIQKLIEGEEEPASVRYQAIQLVQSLELWFKEKQSGLPSEQEAKIFKELERARDYLHDRAASARLILEHLALMI